jgi:hypothetical protein
LGFGGVGFPPALGPPPSPKLFNLGCFGAGFAWPKSGAPPCQIPSFSGFFGIFWPLFDLNIENRLKLFTEIGSEPLGPKKPQSRAGIKKYSFYFPLSHKLETLIEGILCVGIGC